MIIISHRGNINGPNPMLENNPRHIEELLQQYPCEIDVWLLDRQWFLGHDGPQYNVSHDFLLQDGLWIHAKNIQSLEFLIKEDVNCFWHENDDYTITSQGYIWAYPGKQSINGTRSVAVLPERYNTPLDNFFAVCTDYIDRYK